MSSGRLEMVTPVISSFCSSTLLRLGGMLPPDARVLEVGCGAGYGTELILRRFAAARVDAIDLDPAMVTRAKRRLAGYGERVRLATGDMTDLRTALDAEDNSYDAVFDFAIVHHVPDWRAALAEIVRVLKPGGHLLAFAGTRTQHRMAVLLRRGHRRRAGHPRLPVAVRPPHR